MAYRLFLNVRITSAQDYSLNADDVAEVAGLDIEDGPPKPGPFVAYELEPPSPPKLKHKGIVTMDITEQFIGAAQSMSTLKCVCSRHVLILL